LAAMGVDSSAMRRVLRISSGYDAAVADWQALLVAICESHEVLRSDAADSGTQVISI
jgi:cysteine sulfinate desulfinase/cysteine desulfurase-like protein